MLTPVLSPPHPQIDSLVTIGRILKPFGVRGEVKIESMSDVPGRFEGLETVYLTLPDKTAIPMKTTVTGVRDVTAGYLMTCSSFSTPEEAAHFRGAWVQIPSNADLPREPDVYYQFELIGLRVEDPDGIKVGNVEEIMEYPQHHVLVVRNQEEELLIPMNRRAIEKVDLGNQCVQLTSKEWWDIRNAL